MTTRNSKTVVLVKNVVGGSKVYSSISSNHMNTFITAFIKLHTKDSHTTVVTKYFAN